MLTPGHPILTPFDIGNIQLKNRFAVAPMTRVSATEDGNATEQMARYYERFAKGGFGLVITEGIYTDRKFSQGYPCQPGIADHAQAMAWRAVTDRIHSHPSRVFAQLMHAGALNQGNRFIGGSAAPSAVRPKGTQMPFYYGSGQYPMPQAMTDEDIADAIDGFAQAAKRAVDVAGFDGIEIHGANGYLLDQFLTGYTNQRNDRWGGDVRQRLGLMLEVVKAVRTAVGNAAVGVRISQGKVNDYQHKWPEGEAAAEVIFGALADAEVDFIHVTEFEAWKPAYDGGDATLVALARRYADPVPVIANGGLHHLHHAEQAIREGANIIALGKAALANPDFPVRLVDGRGFRELEPSILGPIANIKASELA
ncbi:NADH:flavin oxidoreductase [Pseudomonas sp. R5(2019)]|uniref:NADH:flavin oxidoreductase n=1 Tax=Pseudomonas sp. R5(2019) TaxID=2697566 RepID=UPI00141205D9|nr:NADH:flavin oxidoreductase [Pseudomonas sp. R5(2019)]NBA98470.1 NADH:flavin oxidoreductase [Pseudomonas sp. R5(2019)]